MFVDISCNITDSQFKDNELDSIISRCKDNKTFPIFVGLDLESSMRCLQLADKYDTFSYAGIHPLYSKNTNECLSKLIFNNSKNTNECLSKLIFNNSKNTNECLSKLIGVGECGLDYYRLEYSDKETQKRIFKMQLDLQGERYFIHSRDSHRDLLEILSDYSINGVIHSFTGTVEESKELIKKGYFVGINGCSLKSEEGLEVVRNLPINQILVETDSPYCKIRPSYAGYKYIKTSYTLPKILKKRNEPSCLRQVVEIIGGIKGINLEDMERILEENSIRFYGNKLKEAISRWNDIKQKDME
ncbi:hypothetical protein P3W45_000159 [Vairimorpha bombi]